MSATPILDGEQPLPALKASNLGALLFCAAFVGAAFVLGERAEVDGIPWLPLASPITLLVGVLAHELGHVLAGRAVGFEPRRLAVGALDLNKEAAGWRLRVGPLLIGGFALMIPRSTPNLKRRYFLFVLGGPAVTISLLIIGFMSRDGSWLRGLLHTNLVIMMLSCIPFMFRCQPNDAKSLLMLVGKPSAAERICAMLHLCALDSEGVQPRDWPREVVDSLAIDTGEIAYLPSCLGLRHAAALDGDDTDRIGELLERALAISHKMTPEERRDFFTAASAFHGITRQNAALAKIWLDRAAALKGILSQKDWESIALAALSIAEQRYAEAVEHLTRYLSFLDRKLPGGMTAAERERIAALRDRLASASADSDFDASKAAEAST